MNKSDLVKEILNKNKKYKFSEVEKIVNTFFKEIINALINQRRIELRGFGSFFTKISDKRVCFNPKNCQKIEINKKIHPKFKM